MADPTLAVQEALLAALRTAIGAGKVWDNVPTGTPYPYVVIDGEDAAPLDPLNTRRDERYVYLSIWSSYKGQKEVKQIIALIDGALHHRRLPLDTGAMPICQVTRKRVSLDEDGETYMGTVTVRLVTQH